MIEPHEDVLHSPEGDDRLIGTEDISTRISIRQQTFLALLVACGIILHVVEASLPALPMIPGAKIGLANIVTLMALLNFGFREALIVLILRLFMASLLSGSFLTITFFLSVSGGLMGFWFLNLSYRYAGESLSLIGVSILGAFGHNLGQILMAYYFINNLSLFYYLPYLTIAATLTGFFTGCVALSLNPYIKRWYLTR